MNVRPSQKKKKKDIYQKPRHKWQNTLSSITPAAVGPNGRFVAAQGNLCGCQSHWHLCTLLLRGRSVHLSSSTASCQPCQQAPPKLWGGTGTAWQGIRTWLGDSQAPASQLSTLACCPCNRHWGCWMLFFSFFFWEGWIFITRMQR